MLMLCKDRQPWSPTSDATDLEELLAYSKPLIGTFVSQSQTWLFDCFLGQDWRLAMWTYTLLTDDEVAELQEREFENTRELADWATRVGASRPGSLALSWHGLLHSHIDFELGGLPEAFAVLLNMFEREAADMDRESSARTEAIGLAEDIRRELVS